MSPDRVLSFSALVVAGILAANAAAVRAAEVAASRAASEAMEQIVVRATLREQSLRNVPASVTVLDSATLHTAGGQHFADVLALVPNLNWAGGTSRPRYFQIRGIGEREQYEGAPNPSVGFLIDDIDFSGIGMVATLFDMSQVEVLRGPQGTRYGANALAGLISLRSGEPAREFGASLEATAADHATASLGGVLTGPVEALDSAWRLAVQKFRSDGFRDDAFLGRNDTNDRDELTARFKWRWQPAENTRVDLTVLQADIDNGYDAWSIDNTWRSQTDRPGQDSQRATAGSLRLETSASPLATLTAIGSYARSKSINSFDGDWGNAVLWAPYTYDYFARSERDRATNSLEARLAAPAPKVKGDIAWLIGVYRLHMSEDGRDTSVGVYEDPSFPEFNGSVNDALNSAYRATNAAAFGQLDGRLTDRASWSLGLRREWRKADYGDAGVWEGGPRITALDSRDHMLGGQATAGYDLSRAIALYASVSRGYKAGGFNLGSVPANRLAFKPEYLWNYEIGTKQHWFEGRLYADAALFYSRRRDVQVRTGEQLIPGDPNSYVFFTDNASAGYNHGIESSVHWSLTERWHIGAAAGLLRTRFLGYMQGDVAMPDREQPHAPQYQFAVNADWHHPTGWTARADVAAVDSFYFDVPPKDSRSNSYVLTNLKAGYEAANWSVFVWGRNVFDATYAVRGFFFGNEPPDFTNKLYVQRGDPRQVGVTFTTSFH